MKPGAENTVTRVIARSARPNCNYEGMQDNISSSYEKITLDTGGLLAPVGEAWRRVRRTNPEIELYQSDGSHPSKEGTYLAACVIYAAIFRGMVIGATGLDLNPAHVKVLQKYAQEAVFGQ